jgi:ribosome-associated toxin RatA of RatAB toxin-antitoxin module
MPLVEVAETITAPLNRVWDVVNDVESYPRLMEHVHSLRIVERGDGYRLLEWVVELKGCVMRWIEREDLLPDRHRIEYRQLEGELAEFEGFWQLEPLGESATRVTLSVRFEIGIPMLSEMLNPVAERAIRDNSRNMLMSLASEAAPDAARKESVQEAT